MEQRGESLDKSVISVNKCFQKNARNTQNSSLKTHHLQNSIYFYSILVGEKTIKTDKIVIRLHPTNAQMANQISTLLNEYESKWPALFKFTDIGLENKPSSVSLVKSKFLFVALCLITGNVNKRLTQFTLA